MLNRIKNMDPQTKLVAKAVIAIVALNALAIGVAYVTKKEMIAALDAAEMLED